MVVCDTIAPQRGHFTARQLESCLLWHQELPTPFYFVLQHLQQLGLVATGRFMMAAGQEGGGDVHKSSSIGNVNEGGFLTLCNPLGEHCP